MGSYCVRHKLFAAVTLLFFSLPSLAKQQAAVAMPDSYSAEVAQSILQQGGNAIDAAIAAQFVLAVTLPEAGNIGGGGFMLIRKDGKNDFLDYRETAPQKAHRDMYLDKKGEVIPNLSVFGVLSAGVPGTVAGMWQAHKKYGSLPWKELVQPAVTLAEKGFIIHPKLAENIAFFVGYYQKKKVQVNFAKHFGFLKAGDTFKQADLANALARIRDSGQRGFYQGETAKRFVAFMQTHGGLINQQDLDNYQVKWRTPIQAQWNGYQLLSAPPPSSGGIAVLQWLSMYQRVIQGMDKPEHNSQQYVHILSEIGKRVFADRAEYLGDPDFVQVPVAKLLSPQYLDKRAKEVNLQQISVTNNVKAGLYESPDTTHFSILDQWGNAVSNTTTINYTFGSGVVVEGLGFILNDEMDDFSAKPGAANVYGALGNSANEIQPQKRMLSSMSPTMLLKDNKVELITGSPGGTTIITSVYQSILNVVEYNMDAQQAVDSPRFHHQLYPKDTIKHYNSMPAEVLKQLQGMGYKLEARKKFGDLQLIVNKQGKLSAASEKYGRGQSLVF